MTPATDNSRAPNATDRAIGKSIRDLRLAGGISQEKLAKAVGVTFQQIQKYERGANRISASKLYAIALALGVEASQFMPERTDTSRPSVSRLQAPIAGGSSTPTQQYLVAASELSDIFLRLNGAGRAALLNVARTLVVQPVCRGASGVSKRRAHGAR